MMQIKKIPGSSKPVKKTCYNAKTTETESKIPSITGLMYRYFNKICNNEHISSWKSKGLFDEIIKPPTKSHNGLAPALSYIDNKTIVKFDGGCLNQETGKQKIYTLFRK